MDAKTFIAEFSHLAEAPNGIAKLREMILQLAVQGKLVPQNSNDESADVLINKIRKEKSLLIANSLSRKATALPPINAAIKYPKGWAYCRMIDIAIDFMTGPFGSALHKADYVPNGIPVINPASLKNECITPLPEMCISKNTFERLSAWSLQENDILLARRGEMGRCALVSKKEVGWLCGTGSVILRLSRSVYHPYIIKLIGSDSIRTYLFNSSIGTTMSNLNQRILMLMEISLPPFEEQKRIVAKVDELMALCDELEAAQMRKAEGRTLLNNASLDKLMKSESPAAFKTNWRRVHDHFDMLYDHPATVPALRQAILQLAVQGKLVPQDPTDEPADVLVKKIKDIKATSEKQNKKHVTNDLLVSPADLPRGWAIEELAALALDFQNGISKRNSTVGELVPVLRLADIKNSSLTEDGLRQIPLTHKELEKYRVSVGDILIIRVNGSPSLVGLFVPCSINKEWAYCDHLIRVRIATEYLNYRYLCLFANTQEARIHIQSHTITTAGQKTINQGGLGSLPVWVPPIAEQKRIVAKVDQLMALCDELEAKLSTTQSHAESLMAAIAHKLTA